MPVGERASVPEQAAAPRSTTTSVTNRRIGRQDDFVPIALPPDAGIGAVAGGQQVERLRSRGG
jgi:hypothetical protein